ncbi:hypothetical protein [Brevibacillus brevis]|uniref:hypothetical protein n=1 Tax=Brevibacillus brevis TaxID=1393 RepID=UPI000AD796DC|nr:hypothetical protein [Brevibacillus brevis]
MDRFFKVVNQGSSYKNMVGLLIEEKEHAIYLNLGEHWKFWFGKGEVVEIQ